MSPLKGVAKGNPFARLVASYLGTEPRTLSGNHDRGDLVHPVWAVEVKAPGRGRPLDLSAAMNEARVEAANAGVDRWCVITRRTGYPLDQAYVTLPLWMARALLPDLDTQPQLRIVDVPTGGAL